MKLAAATIVLALSAPALADDECETSADCGGLHCIQGRCTTIDDARAHLRSHASESVPGSSPMFGDGHGYVTTMIIGDVSASLAAIGLVTAAFATGSGWLAFVSLFPATLTGPIIHGANGRGAPAAISFFAWASVPPSSVGVAALATINPVNDSSFQDALSRAIIAGYITAIVASAGLTALDAWMAREVNVRDTARSFSILPSIAPTRGGVTAALTGTF